MRTRTGRVKCFGYNDCLFAFNVKVLQNRPCICPEWP
ncbi:hypothetical protein [Serratia plymuthica]